MELTSGNTGIGLAIVAAVRGYRFHAVMSEGNSVERRRMLRALGADVVLVPQAPGGVPGEVSGEDLELVEHRAAELTAELRAFRPDQFNNRSGFEAHEETTGPEIWEQTGGAVDAFVASIGTAGTFVGVARALKKRNPAIRCIAAEPAGTRTLAGCEVISSHHRIQGTGYNMVPPLWAPELCDEYLGVTDEDAVRTTRLLATREGIFVDRPRVAPTSGPPRKSPGRRARRHRDYLPGYWSQLPANRFYSRAILWRCAACRQSRFGSPRPGDQSRSRSQGSRRRSQRSPWPRSQRPLIRVSPFTHFGMLGSWWFVNEDTFCCVRRDIGIPLALAVSLVAAQQRAVPF